MIALVCSLTEWRYRKVSRVASYSGVAAWLIVQVAAAIFPVFRLSGWAVRLHATIATYRGERYQSCSQVRDPRL